MTKNELVEWMAEEGGITKAQAGKALNSVLEGITGAIKGKDGKIQISGLGSFALVNRKARAGVNPATGEKITIAARKAIRFQAAKALKDAVAE
jgi:DNA-binding protein HU-beta